MPAVHSLTVTGYKSIRELRQFGLTNLNVLIGANGAGKSNFISLFRLLAELADEHLQIHVQRQGGPDALLHFGRENTERLHAEFNFGVNSYKFALIPTGDNRLIFESEESGDTSGQYLFKNHLLGIGHDESKLRTATDACSAEVWSAVTNWRVYHFHDTGEHARVKRRHPGNDNLRLQTDAANLAAYLHMLHKDHLQHYQSIVQTIQLVAPYFRDFVLRPDAEFVELEWTQSGKPDTVLKGNMLSDGTLRFICLATLLLQPVHLLPDTVLIDEPELGLHPYAIAVLADLFKQVSENRQLIISTQSVELVNELNPEDVIVVDQEDDASIFRRCDKSALSGWLEEYAMGEIWKRNILGGRP